MSICETSRVRDFFRQLTNPSRSRIDARDVAVVVAHPDDETIGCGALLSRMEGGQVVVVTDGAPKDLVDANKYGFCSVEAYAQARTRELRTALEFAGHSEISIHQFCISDQQAAYQLKEIISRLQHLFSLFQIRIVLTHAFEGGHPDHDSVALSAHHAAACCGAPVSVVEMPFYRSSQSGERRQSFAPSNESGVIAVNLTPTERRLKELMVSQYKTQKEVLSWFSVEREQFRIAPAYDFTEAPNSGCVLYDRQSWGMRSQEWLACARSVCDGAGD